MLLVAPELGKVEEGADISKKPIKEVEGDRDGSVMHIYIQ